MVNLKAAQEKRWRQRGCNGNGETAEAETEAAETISSNRGGGMMAEAAGPA